MFPTPPSLGSDPSRGAAGRENNSWSKSDPPAPPEGIPAAEREWEGIAMGWRAGRERAALIDKSGGIQGRIWDVEHALDHILDEFLGVRLPRPFGFAGMCLSSPRLGKVALDSHTPTGTGEGERKHGPDNQHRSKGSNIPRQARLEKPFRLIRASPLILRSPFS